MSLLSLGLNFGLRPSTPSGPATADYIIANDTDMANMLANSDGTLSGKIADITGTGFGQTDFTNRTFDPPLTIRGAGGALGYSNVSNCSGLTFEDLTIQFPVWPASNSGAGCMKFSGANSDIIFNGGTIRHGYGATFAEFDTAATLSEYSDTTGLSDKLASAFAADGGTTIENVKVLGVTFEDLDNGIKSMGTLSGEVVFMDNVFRRVYQDIISLGNFNSASASNQLYVLRNQYELPFAFASDDGNPHGDIMQIGATATVDTGNILIAGNAPLYSTRRGVGATQGVFIEQLMGAYTKIKVIGNIIAGESVNQGYVGGTDPAQYCDEVMFYANTLAGLQGGHGNTLRVAITTYSGTSKNNIIDGNLAESFQAQTDERMVTNNATYDDTSPTTVFPNWANRMSAASLDDMLSAYSTVGGTAAGAGAADVYYDLIDTATTDHTTVVKWENVHPGVDWSDDEAVAASTLTTLPLKVLINEAASIPVVPNAASEWRECTDDTGSTVVTDWTASSGNATGGNAIQFRATSGADALDAVVAGGTVNGFTVGSTLTTEIAPATFLVSNASSATYFQRSATVGSDIYRITTSMKFNVPSAPADNATFMSLHSGNFWLFFDYTLGDQFALGLKNSGGTSVSNGAREDYTLLTDTWYLLEVDANHATQERTITVNGVVLLTGPMSGGTDTDVFANVAPYMLANTGGADRLPVSTKFADMSMTFHGASDDTWTISNDATTANADPARKGGTVTQG